MFPPDVRNTPLELIGQRVRIQGLTARKKKCYNGKSGTITAHDKTTGTYEVLIDPPLCFVRESGYVYGITSESTGRDKIVRVLFENLVPFKRLADVKEKTRMCAECLITKPCDEEFFACSVCKHHYCSRECQKQDWDFHKCICKLRAKAQTDHKAENEGKDVLPDSLSWHAQAKRACNEMIELFRQEGVLLLKQIAEQQTGVKLEDRRGVITLDFSDPWECHAACLILRNLFRGRSSQYIQLDVFFYQPKSFDGDESLESMDSPSYIDLSPRLPGQLDDLAKNHDPCHGAVIWLEISDAHRYYGEVVALPLLGDGTVGLHLSPKKQKLSRLADSMLSIKLKIMRSPEYRECRKLMLQFHTMHQSVLGDRIGVVFIRNVFDTKNFFYKKERHLAAITPTVLLQGLQSQMQASNENSILSCDLLFGESLRDTPQLQRRILDMIQRKRNSVGCSIRELLKSHAVIMFGAYVHGYHRFELFEYGLLAIDPPMAEYSSETTGADIFKISRN